MSANRRQGEAPTKYSCAKDATSKAGPRGVGFVRRDTKEAIIQRLGRIPLHLIRLEGSKRMQRYLVCILPGLPYTNCLDKCRVPLFPSRRGWCVKGVSTSR